ncbi:MAG: prephenate dehydrogenase/arogenate dehydrogenase family protein [Methanomassiliicoccales archaeon]
MPDNVDAIRWHIEEVDNQIMDLIAERMRLALQMGQYKVGKGMPVRHVRVEEQVEARYVSRAKQAGISEEAARRIARILVHESVDAQFRIPHAEPRRITVVGGSGKMGAWLCRHFDSQGHKVMVNDIVSSTFFPYENDLKRAVSRADVVVLATPISNSKDMLEKVIALKPKGLVFDICSIKDPILPALRKAVDKGITIASVHPMFGPETISILDKNILICDCGSSEGTEGAKALFSDTGANVHTIKVEEHDRLMSIVLGMSHALNLAFFTALSKSGYSREELDRAASTTFRHQACTAARVAMENPELYYEIQHLNPHTRESFDLMVRSLDEVRQAAMAEEGEEFERLMETGRKYFGGTE